MSDTPDFAPEIELARRFAALSGAFDPQDALKASVPEGLRADAAVTVAAHLAVACDTHAGTSGSQWLMRGTERRWDIDAMQKSGQLADAIAWRTQQAPFDDATRDVVAALRGVDAFSPSALETALADTTDDPPDQQRTKLQGLAYALEWAGPAAPGYAHLERLRAKLNRLDDKLRSDTILARGFHGREEQRKVLSDWIAGAARTTPVQALFVTGLPGIGKSALLEIAVKEAAAAGHPLLVVRLDFDRRVLDVLDKVGLTLETARQIAAQLPDEASLLRELRLEASGARDEDLKGRGREIIPSELASALGGVVAASGRIVVMVLDTCEVLRGRGETHPRRLFEWLDKLVALGLAPMAVVAAGRGDALDSISERIGKPLDLAGLTPDRFLLSRIADPDLRRLADPGLLVRRINFEVIRDVLAPVLGLKRIGDQRAKRLIEELEMQNWLVERDPLAEGWLRQRPAMRAQLVPLFYASKPARCVKIDRAAAAWFERRSEPWLATEALYHRLQLMRRGEAAPTIDRDVAVRFDDAMLSELPDQARDRVLQARGQRSTVGRGIQDQPASVGPVDPRAVKDLQFISERGDWAEAADLYARVFEPAQIDPASDAGHAVRTFLWRVGRWLKAKKSLRDLDATSPGDDDLAKLRPDDALALLEMRAEFSFRRIVGRLAADDEWRDLAHRVAGRGAKTDISTGALGFALRAEGIWIESSSRRVDPVRAVDELWVIGGSSNALDNAVSVAQERMARRAPQAIDPTQMPSSLADPSTLATTLAARRLAVHTPYASPLSLLAQFESGNRLASHARSTLLALTRAAAWWNGGIGSMEVAPSREPQDSIEALTDLGLVAEWAGVAAFVLGDSNLALIAKSAEAWRRTTAGLWAYGRAPRHWTGAQHAGGLDVSLWVRVHELFSADDPVASSQAMLVAWAGGADTLPEKLRGRLTTLAAHAKAATARRKGPERALAAALALTRARAPAAFVPALATLVALKHSP